MADVDTFDDLSVEGSKPKKTIVDNVKEFLTGPDTFDDLSVEGSKPSTRNQSVKQAVQGEVARSSGAISGGAIGFSLGARTLNPYVATATTLAGAAGGLYLGDEYVRKALKIPDIKDMPAEDRPAAYTAEALTGSALMTMPVLGALVFGARATGIGIGKFFNEVVRMAGTSPKAYVAVETIPAVTTAVAAGAAEKAAPGSDIVRLGTQIAVGGLTSGLIYRAGFAASTRLYKGVIDRFGKSKQTERSVKTIKELLGKEGVDPATVVAAAKQAGYENLTVGQYTANPVIIGIERDLMKHNERFARESVDETKATFDLMRMRINLLAQSGDPNDLATAAKMRQSMFKTLIEGHLMNAKDELAVKVAPLIKDGRVAESAISEMGTEAMMKTLNQSEGHMDELWKAVDQTGGVTTSNLEKEVARIAYNYGDQLGAHKVPTFIYEMLEQARSANKGAVKILGPDGKPMVDDLGMTEFRNAKANRGELLQLARKARITGADADANIYNSLAASILDDMDASLANGASDAYDIARAFTREHHNVFTRSFAGKSLAITRFGERMDPGVILRKAMAGGNVVAHEQMADLAEATRFMRSRGLADNSATDAMMDAQSRIVKIMALGSIDETTGRVNAKTLSAFVEKYESLLRNQFPEVRAEMLDAIKSEESLRKLQVRLEGIETLVGTNSAFAKISRTDPVAFASSALRSTSDQEGKIVAMINVAKRGGRSGGRNIDPQTATDSVKASIYNAAINMSMSKEGVIDLATFRTRLFNPTVVGRKAPIDVLLEHGAVTTSEVKDLREMFNVMDNVNTWLKQGTALDAGDQTANFLRTFFAKVGGSLGLSAAKKVTGFQGGSADLIIHSQVANTMNRVVNTIPLARQKDVILALMTDRQAFARAMDASSSATKQLENTKFLNAWLVQWGFSAEGALIDHYTVEDEKP